MKIIAIIFSIALMADCLDLKTSIDSPQFLSKYGAGKNFCVGSGLLIAGSIVGGTVGGALVGSGIGLGIGVPILAASGLGIRKVALESKLKKRSKTVIATLKILNNKTKDLKEKWKIRGKELIQSIKENTKMRSSHIKTFLEASNKDEKLCPDHKMLSRAEILVLAKSYADKHAFIIAGKKAYNQDDKECSICFEKYDKKRRPMYGDCRHMVCEKCYPKLNGTCPTCRGKLNKGKIYCRKK